MAYSTLLSLLLLLPLLSLSLYLLGRNKKKKPNLPPGPTNLPIVGSLHQLGLLPHHSLFALSRKHGPLMHLKLGKIPVVVASSADTARAFLKTHDLDCCSRPLLTSLDRLSYGSNDVAFAPYGEQWRELRKVCIIELLSSKKVLSFRPIRQEEVDRMVGSIASQSDAVNLSEELMSLANHITCRTAIGKRYHAAGEGSRLKRVLAETEAMFMGFFFEDYFPLLGWMDRLTGMRARLERNFSELDRFYQEVIDEHRDPTWTREEDRAEDAIDALLNVQKSGGANWTDEHIKAVLMTGSGITYTMGTGCKDSSHIGLIPQVIHALSNKIGSLKHQADFSYVSFIEAHIRFKGSELDLSPGSLMGKHLLLGRANDLENGNNSTSRAEQSRNMNARNFRKIKRRR